MKDQSKPVTIDEILKNYKEYILGSQGTFYTGLDSGMDLSESKLAINKIVMDIIGEDQNVSIASRGAELDAITFAKPYMQRRIIGNDLRREQRLTANQYGLGEK